jgi:membrane associated rhomboid family serine protease
MIPVTDAVRSRRTPVVNVAIIIACTLVFIYELTLSLPDLNRFFFDYSVIPAELNAWANHPSGLRTPSTVITSAFLHGGWLHLGGNMIFLWVFGDNVEDALGHVLYALFYVVCAAGAITLQVAMDAHSTVPVLGASGAIAGVLGGYLLLYPRAPVGVVVPLIWFFGLIPVPAWLMILLWFGMQLFTGIASIGTTSAGEGVAVWARVGGFITGLSLMIAARPFIPKRSLSQPKPGRQKRVW